MDFREYVTEGYIEKGLTYDEIVSRFDTIEDVIIEPDGKTIRTRGKKDGKFADVYTTCKTSKIAKDIFAKIDSVTNEATKSDKETYDAIEARYKELKKKTPSDLKSMGDRVARVNSAESKYEYITLILDAEYSTKEFDAHNRYFDSKGK